MGQAHLSSQLGRSEKTVSDNRLHLVRLGMVVKIDVEGLREAFWFPCLPPGVERKPPGGLDTEARRRWVLEQAAVLDEQISETESSVRTPLIDARRRAALSRETPLTHARPLTRFEAAKATLANVLADHYNAVPSSRAPQDQWQKFRAKLVEYVIDYGGVDRTTALDLGQPGA